MPDILILNSPRQPTSAPTLFFDQLPVLQVIQPTSQACITDLTPPTFAGIATLTIGSRGQMRATWLAGTDASLPIRYEVYIKGVTSSGLFSSINLIAITDKLQFDIFTLPDGTVLQNGTTYFLGVRAVDAVGNRDGNTVSLSLLSNGVGLFSDSYEAHGAFVVNASNQFQGTLWGTRNGRIDPGMVLGVGSYQIYDKTGTLVSGMAESGIVADANSQFKITPVTSILSASLDHYMVKVTIVIDGSPRINYVPLIEKAPEYDIGGLFFVDSAQQFDGSFWVSADEQVRTTGLGTASFQVYDRGGSVISGMSGSGISADGNGVFKITALPSLLGSDLLGYSVKVSILIDGITRSEFLPVTGKIPSYMPQGAFTVNASNQLQGTLWILKDGVVDSATSLGTASYQVYDRLGAAVSGLTQAGIAADGNAQFKITPVLATLLSQSAEHYVIKVTITADGVARTGYVPLVRKQTEYDIGGLFFVNAANNFDGTFWVSAEEQLKVLSLGTGSYEVFDHQGGLVSGMSQFGISPNADGVYAITQITSLLSDYYPGYSVRVTMTVDGVLRSEMFGVNGRLPNYEIKGVFSINALNQLQATIWVVKDGQRDVTSLGAANFTVYDAAGVAVSGLTQTGIAADGNGRYISTPLSAALLADLTHYTVKLGVVVQGIERISYKGFTLLGN